MMDPAQRLAEIESDLSPDAFAEFLENAKARLESSFTSKPAFNGAEWYLPKSSCCSAEVLGAEDGEEAEECCSYDFDDGQGVTLKCKRSAAVERDASSSSSSSSSSCLPPVLSITNLHPLSLLVRVSFLILLWLWMWLALPRSITEPGGAIFDMLACFIICFLCGSLIGRALGIPPLLFVFGMGILWGNIPVSSSSSSSSSSIASNLTGMMNESATTTKTLVDGINPDIRNFVSRFALTIILIRSGLAMRWKTIKPAAVNIITMSIFPMLVEVIIHGFLAAHLIDYGDSSLWPFLQAMTASPSASAVVGATVLDMRKRGFGVTRGPGVLLVPSVILDFTLGIYGINFVAELTFRSADSSLAWAIAKGPVQLIAGILIGIALGFVWYGVFIVLLSEAKPIRRSGKTGPVYSSDFLIGRVVSQIGFVVLLLMGLLCVFVGYTIDVAGGGCIAATFCSATVQYILTNEPVVADPAADEDAEKVDQNEPASSSPAALLQEAEEHERNLAFYAQTLRVHQQLADMYAAAWDWIVMPALFGFSGSAIRVNTMFAADFFGPALACIFTGVTARIIVCTVCTWSYDMTVAERIISMIASGGRGSAQVALGGYALALVRELPGGGTEEQRRYGRHVYDTATLGVILMGSLSIILLTRVMPCFCLTDAEYERQQEEMEKQQRELVDGDKELTTMPPLAIDENASDPVPLPESQ